MRSGGQIVVDNLASHGVETVFHVPGESFLPVLDALHDRSDLRLITCRHESSAANMAEATGKLTGRAGVCFVTRGPGACHASVAVHTAYQDSTPLVLFVGQVDSGDLGRGAFQEVDVATMFGWTAKFAGNVPSAKRLPEYIGRAFAQARGGRPGPVVVGLPEDIQEEKADVVDAVYAEPPQGAPAAHDLARLGELVAGASRPLMIVGGSGWTQQACDAVVHFAEQRRIPTAVTFRRQDHFDNRSPAYVGDLAFALDPGLERTVREADLVVALGTRLGDLATGGYRLLRVPEPEARLIHIHPEAAELGRVYRPTLAIQATPVAMAAALRALPGTPCGAAWAETARARYLRSVEPVASVGAVDMHRVVAALHDRLGDDGIVATDAGNFAQWVQRFYPFRRLGTQLAPRSGAMGYGVPAAIAAKLARPQRTAVGIVGDGGFLMASNELATALQHDLAPVIVVVNNGMYGTIRAHQERRFPGRVVGTDLRNPSFAGLAEAFGAWSATVRETADFADALDQALMAGRAAVIDLHLDPENISVGRTIADLRGASR